MDQSPKRHKKLLAYLDKWIKTPQNDRRADWTKALRKSLNEKSPHALAAGAMQVWFLANWHAQHGLHKLVCGDAAGWMDLSLSLEYRWLHQRLNPGMTQPSETALLLAHHRSLGLEERSQWLANRLRELRAGSPLWQFSRFGAFLLLMESTTPGDPAQTASSLGVYAQLAQAWKADGSEVGAALGMACDYHLEQALSQEGYPEFALSPYDLMPVEVLLIDRLRQGLGLGGVVVQHPLTSIPLLMSPVSHAGVLEDENVERLAARAQAQGML